MTISIKYHNDITILLTIYNRIEFTKKWLDFAEKQKLPFKILISDGGNIKNIKKILKLKDRNLNITYKKYKYYRNFFKLWEKYYFALQHVRTKYVILVEDDDYLCEKSLRKSANFLSKNIEFSSVKGLNCLGELVEYGKKIKLILRNENQENIDYSLIDQKPESRLIKYFSLKCMTIFDGLHRTSILKKTFSKFYRKNFYNLYITELIICLLLINYGKIKRTRYIDYIKMDNTRLSSSENFTNYRPFSKIVFSKNFAIENNFVLKFLNFKNDNIKNKFIILYYKFLDHDKKGRLEREIFFVKFKKFFRSIFKSILVFFGLFNYIKIFIFQIKYKNINKNIIIKNQNIEKAVKYKLNFFDEIVYFNSKNNLIN